MSRTSMAVWAALLLAVAGLTLARIAGRRLFVPLFTGVAGLLLIVAAVVVARPAATRAAAHHARPAPAFTTHPQDNPCLPVPTALGAVPLPGPNDPQRLPDQISGVSMAHGIARRSFAQEDTQRNGHNLSAIIGSALIDVDEGKYYSPGINNDFLPTIDVAIGTVKNGGCDARQLLIDAIDGQHGKGETYNVLVIVDPGPHLARVHAILACGEPSGVERGYAACAWATDGPGTRLIGQMFLGGNGKPPLTPAQGAATADLIFAQLTH